MQFKQNSTVKSATGETVGRVSHFVMDPRSNEITHLVVEKGFLFMEDRVIPIQAVATTNADEITLGSGEGEPEDFPLFDNSYFVRAGEYSTEPEAFPALSAYYYYPPVVSGGAGGPLVTPVAAPSVTREAVEELPEHTVAIRKGADVYTSDETLIGQVDEVFTSAEHNNRVSHIIISQGLLMKSHKLIPVHWIAAMSSERVDLGTSRAVIDDLPDYTP